MEFNPRDYEDWSRFEDEWPKGETMIQIRDEYDLEGECHSGECLPTPSKEFSKWEDIGKDGNKFEKIYCGECRNFFYPLYWRYKDAEENDV